MEEENNYNNNQESTKKIFIMPFFVALAMISLIVGYIKYSLF